MVAIKKIKSKNMSDVLKSCLETVREGWEKTLASTLEWTLHPTAEDAVSELARSELVFLMVVNSLAKLDAEMSVILLKEVDRWSLFPRITNYMSGKMKSEWKVPREILDRAAKFAIILERSGMFTELHVCLQELHCYLAELLAEEEGNEEKNSEECKRLRKDPHKTSPSLQEEESSVAGQATGGEPQQVIRVKLVARRRSHMLGGRGQWTKGKQTPHHQVLSSPTQEIGRSTTEITPAANKAQTSACPQRVDKPPTGAITKVLHQGRYTSPQTVHISTTGSTTKVHDIPMASPSETLIRPSAGAIPKVGKPQRSESPEAVNSLKTVPIPNAYQISSKSCQTEERPISKAAEVSTAACQTSPRMTRAEAQRQLWEGVERDDGLAIREAVLSGADLKEARVVDWMIPLTLAARDGREGALRALLSLGAELERTGGEWHETALHWASWEGHVTVVRELLAAGANIGALSWERSTPLHYASERGHLNTVKVLVEAGARLNARDKRRRTPLILAVKTGSTSVVSYLRSVIANR